MLELHFCTLLWTIFENTLFYTYPADTVKGLTDKSPGRKCQNYIFALYYEQYLTTSCSTVTLQTP